MGVIIHIRKEKCNITGNVHLSHQSTLKWKNHWKGVPHMQIVFFQSDSM